MKLMLIFLYNVEACRSLTRMGPPVSEVSKTQMWKCVWVMLMYNDFS